jgi:hypothetical protein
MKHWRHQSDLPQQYNVGIFFVREQESYIIILKEHV